MKVVELCDFVVLEFTRDSISMMLPLRDSSQPLWIGCFKL
jgi:hypothetical protein